MPSYKFYQFHRVKSDHPALFVVIRGIPMNLPPPLVDGSYPNKGGGKFIIFTIYPKKFSPAAGYRSSKPSFLAFSEAPLAICIITFQSCFSNLKCILQPVNYQNTNCWCFLCVSARRRRKFWYFEVQKRVFCLPKRRFPLCFTPQISQNFRPSAELWICPPPLLSDPTLTRGGANS